MSFADRKSSPFKQYSGDSSGCISTFVIKIYNLLNQPQNAQAICWHHDGTSFLIKDTLLLTTRVLPLYFRHSNYQSFIRQLNMYSFVKMKDHAVHRFRNAYFLRDREELLKFIKRKPEKKKRRQSDDSIQSQKENELRSQSSSRRIPINQQDTKSDPPPEPCLLSSTQSKKEEADGGGSLMKKVRFEEPVRGGNSDQNISTIIQPTSKWIKEENYWSNIKSLKSIDLSMRLIEDQDDRKERPSSKMLPERPRNTLEHPIILLFNPNISEKTIKSIGLICEE